MASNCMYCLPHELTGIGRACGLLKGMMCNDLEKRCACFKRHTAESRKALAEAIEIKRKDLKGNKEAANG